MIKKIVASLACICLISYVYYFANQDKLQARLPFSNASKQEKSIADLKIDASKTWSNYLNLRTYGGIGSIEELDKIVANGYLVGSRENFDQVIALLRTSLSNEEKFGLLRVLGVLYRNSSDLALRSDISRYLIETIQHSTETSVIKEATFVLTRLGFFPETLGILDHAFAEGHITSNDYYGEMAHVMPAAPVEVQSKLIENIGISGNDYARDVMVSILADRSTTEALSPKTLKAAASFMNRAEPDLPHQRDNFGGIQAINWQNWLASNVAINSQLSGETDAAALAKLLNLNDIDPRKLVIAFWTEPSAENMKAAFDDKTLSKAADIISAYGAANPQDLGIQEYTNTALSNLRSRKK